MGRKELPWSGESMIQTYVGLVVNDVLQLLGKQDELCCLAEMGIFNIRPDWWIIATASGRPIGVIKVKRPSDSIMEEDGVHGQLFDYMLKLKTYFGLQGCFGIVTTYEQWRIYWDTDAQELAESDSVEEPEDIEKPFDLSSLPTPNLTQKDNTDSTYYQSPKAKDPRKLKASKNYEWNDKELITVLASVVLKMLACPTVAVPGLLERRAYIVLQQSSWIGGLFKLRSWITPNFLKHQHKPSIYFSC